MKKKNKELLKQQKIQYWTIDRLKKEASNYCDLSDLKKGSPYAYLPIKSQGLKKYIKDYFYNPDIKSIEPDFLFRKPKAITQEDKERLIAHRYFNQIKTYLKKGEELTYIFDDFKTDIERKMKKDMSWSNFGTVWEIKHINPRIDFVLNIPPGTVHYALSNLKPTYIEQTL
jgi:hypothetical protein